MRVTYNPNIFLILFSLLIFWSCGNETKKSYTVVDIIDGNTIKLSNGFALRIIGINSNTASKNSLNTLLINQEIEFKKDLNIKHKDRKIASVYVTRKKDNLSIARSLLLNGISTLNRNNLHDSLGVFQTYSNNASKSVVETKIVKPKKQIDSPKKSKPVQARREISDIVAEVEKGVFIIHALDEYDEPKSYGTGFFINKNGYALSNYHVFEGGSKFVIQLKEGGKPYEIKEIIHYDRNQDYIIYKLDISKSLIKPLTLSKEKAIKGSDVIAIGHPKGFAFTVSRGIVSAIRHYEDLKELIQIDAPISPGSSGGPLLNRKGEVIGVATLGFPDCQNCNGAIAIDGFKDVLKRYNLY